MAVPYPDIACKCFFLMIGDYLGPPGEHPLEGKAGPSLGLRTHLSFCTTKSSETLLSLGLEEMPFPSLVKEDLSVG